MSIEKINGKVTIDLSNYEYFKKMEKVAKGSISILHSFVLGIEFEVLSHDEAVKFIAKENEMYKKYIDSSMKDNRTLHERVKNSVKNLSILDFIKLKFTK